MKINTTDPDLRTIFARIEEGSLDLQPNFQRAEVWRSQKKKLLIDTILRGWQVPPVHVIWDQDADVQEVLDGQQRLTAVKDFMSNQLKIDGTIEPYDYDIHNLHGLSYLELPAKVKNRFDRYSIRFFEIAEYNQGEPGELFNRLNESLKLTSAEKRNAYVGKLRNQMKFLSSLLAKKGLDRKFLGFSNQRLAYQDLFTKLCFYLEADSLTASYTEKRLNDLFREDIPFDDNLTNALVIAINVISNAKLSLESKNLNVHVTKASLFSWLFFIARIKFKQEDNFDEDKLINTFVTFESLRYQLREGMIIIPREILLPHDLLSELCAIFTSRSTSKVMTSASLMIRDLIIATFYNSQHENDELWLSIYQKDFCLVILPQLKNIKDITVENLMLQYVQDIQWMDT